MHFKYVITGMNLKDVVSTFMELFYNLNMSVYMSTINKKKILSRKPIANSIYLK